MELQEGISAKRLKEKVGRTLRVLVDDIGDDGVAVARSSADAPEIDGLVYVENPGKARVGDFLDVKIKDSDAHDLYAAKARIRKAS
jgi:ribosomal protein S12 methylthiotransferase